MKTILLKIIQWILIIFVINVIMSALWASVKGFILVDASTAIILGILVGCILNATIFVLNKHKNTFNILLVLIMLGMSFCLHYLLTMKIMSTTIKNANNLWWYVF
ncbi:MAG: hypothetical protein CVU55_13785 [Deltaproteobacteria bacterium HGW-Deltaproteobacteria-13]|nr:MAG: hypothetical protein CVU55_13785 [Deltaproteobacteria bacterium HGW-Deltaproteobacteria-13]